MEFITYERFGAKGDGITDDMDAIIAAHEYANEHDLPVRTTADAHYYIGGGAKTAVSPSPRVPQTRPATRWVNFQALTLPIPK